MATGRARQPAERRSELGGRAGSVTPRLQVTGVAKSFGAVKALQAVDLAIEAGSIHALCGHNGAGKSTLVGILAGVVPPDAGMVSIDGVEAHFRDPEDAQRAGVALVDQEISLIEALSVRDNVLLGLSGAPFVARPAGKDDHVRSLLGQVGLARLDLSKPVAALPLGTRQLVEIARALGRGGKVLILDEPTATLTQSESEQVFRAVRSVAARGISVIYVSHRLGEVLNLCDVISVFRDGRRVVTRAASDLDRAELVDLLIGSHAVATDDRRGRPSGTASPMLEIKGLSVGDGRLHGIDVTVRPGQVVAIAGQVGSGASEVLRAVAGLVPDAVGEVRVNGEELLLGSPIRSLRAGVNYISNDRKSEGLFLARSVDSNLLATRLGSVARGGFIVRRLAKKVAGVLAAAIGLQARERSAVGQLSGGNQQKVFLGRSLLREHRASILLLDEPTRGVDVGGRAEIHELVRAAADAGTAVLYTSTELDEILDLADDVVTLRSGHVVSFRPRAEVEMKPLLYEMTHVEQEAPVL